MDTNTKKEEFSYGYLHLLCAINGLVLQIAPRPIDNTGIDATIVGTEKLRNVRASRIDVQVKCSSQDIEREDFVNFELPVKAYNSLRDEFTYTKSILIVVVVPEDLGAWLVADDDKIILRKCGYWMCLKGYPETKNETTITIKIPKSNIITQRTLLDLLEQESQSRYDLIQMGKDKKNVKS